MSHVAQAVAWGWVALCGAGLMAMVYFSYRERPQELGDTAVCLFWVGSLAFVIGGAVALAQAFW